METIGARIRAARLARTMSQDDVARPFGIKRNAVSLWESDDTRPDPEKMAKLAEILGVTADWLLGGGDTFTPSPVQITPGKELVGDRDLPVYAAAEGGSGHLIVTFDPIQYVRRPEMLLHVRDGYGILVTGESMIPAHYPNSIALVNPRIAATPGDDLVLYHTPPSGDAEAMIKRFLSANTRKWKLEQHRPAKQFEVDRLDWPVAHVVVGNYRRR